MTDTTSEPRTDADARVKAPEAYITTLHEAVGEVQAILTALPALTMTLQRQSERAAERVIPSRPR